MIPQIRRALASLIPGEALLPEGLPDGWPPDASPPAAWVAPGTEEEVAMVLEKAASEGWRVLPSGAGSWLRGADVKEVDILLSTGRLGGVSLYEPGDLTFSAGSGLPFKELQETTAQHGQWVPLDPPGWKTGTLGGVVATGRAGPLRYAFGQPRDHVLGLTLVAGDGRILRWGGRVVKNVAGFDVTRLCIGSWGSLGVITAVSARLFPLPEEDRTVLLTGPALEDVLPVAQIVSGSPLPLSAVELVESCPMLGSEIGTGAAVVLRLLGTGPQVEEMEARLKGMVEGWTGDGRRFFCLNGEDSKGFHGKLSALEGGAYMVLRLSLLPSKREDLLRQARALVREVGGPGMPAVRWALHVGSGVLRMVFPSSAVEGMSFSSLGRILFDLRESLEGDGGSLVLSEGPAELLKDVGAWGHTGSEEPLMVGLKSVFDPAGILPSGPWGG